MMNIKISDFTQAHAEEALEIATAEYRRQRRLTPALPAIAPPPLDRYAASGLGVAAFDGGHMVGYLCSVPVFSNCFGSTRATGAFSPLGANGAAGNKAGEIYAALYTAAGEKWARAGATSHSICLYTHNRQVGERLWNLGFGIRCRDGIRGMDDLPAESINAEYREVPPAQLEEILPLVHGLEKHCAASPFFLHRPAATAGALRREVAEKGVRYFAAWQNARPCAYLRVEPGGETFACDVPGYLHITGAFCAPGQRGTGVYPGLLGHTLRELHTVGTTRLGVDWESLNPPADRFWPKHFSAYTYSVTRRIDENVLATY